MFNDTKVIKARLFGEKASGGKIEVIIERITDARKRRGADPRQQVAQARLARHHPRRLSRSRSSAAPAPSSELFALELEGPGDLYVLIEQNGRLPLPPYIAHAVELEDETRYQTVFARNAGAVAAPTAGLHFDKAMLDHLAAQGVGLAWLTLHVGAGTFQPVRVHNIAEHRMHSERFEIPQATIDAIKRTRARNGRVIAVGTTSLRALESAARGGELRAERAETDIFITPGYRFSVVDRLITNFHLPKSTLLMLVAAFAGSDTIRAAYRHAVVERYRFFSYGDAMLLERQNDAI